MNKKLYNEIYGEVLNSIWNTLDDFAALGEKFDDAEMIERTTNKIMKIVEAYKKW